MFIDKLIFTILILAILLNINICYANELEVPNTYESGQILTSESLNQNFSRIYERVNNHSLVAIIEDFQTVANYRPQLFAGWNSRRVTRVVGNSNFIVINSENRFTVAPGKYLVYGVSPIMNTNISHLRLRNITDQLTEIVGLIGNAPQGQGTANVFLYGYLSLDGSKTFEIQHYSQSDWSNTSANAGTPSKSEEPSIYLSVSFQKLSD